MTDDIDSKDYLSFRDYLADKLRLDGLKRALKREWCHSFLELETRNMQIRHEIDKIIKDSKKKHDR